MCYLKRWDTLGVFLDASHVNLRQDRVCRSPLGQQKLLHMNAYGLACVILGKMFEATPQPIKKVWRRVLN